MHFQLKKRRPYYVKPSEGHYFSDSASNFSRNVFCLEVFFEIVRAESLIANIPARRAPSVNIPIIIPNKNSKEIEEFEGSRNIKPNMPIMIITAGTTRTQP